MKLFEHQARKYFSSYGIPVPEGEVGSTVDEVARIARGMGGEVVVKAQVLTGGRGKAGGVRLAGDPNGAAAVAGDILGMEIRGFPVNKVLVARAVDISREYYISLLVERESKAPMFIACREGGVDIEEVARENPDAIARWTIDPRYGILPYYARSIAYHLNTDPGVVRQIAVVIAGMYRLWEGEDTSLVEINPLVLTPTGEVWAIDAKMTIDDSALYRHPELMALREKEALSITEKRAREMDLSYVKLEGNVGCIVNGAGLAMATMDLIKYYGAQPANFLDIGGSSSPEKVITALEIICSDERVQCVLLNIFGGITRCDDVANGVKEFLSSGKIGVPVVIRLTGTNEEEGIRILNDLGLSATSSMDDAVRKAAEVVVAN